LFYILDILKFLVLVCTSVSMFAQVSGDHASRADQLMKNQMYDAAASEFEAALSSETVTPVIRYHYAICLFAAGRNDEARREFERLTKEAGKIPEIAYYLGRLDLLEGKAMEAIQELAPLQGNSKISDLPYFLGLAYVTAGDQKSGLKWLQQAAVATPRDYHVHYRLARLYTNLGRKADSEREYKLYQDSRDAQKDTETHARACNEALGSSHSGGAGEACRALFDPNDPEKLVLLGQLYGQHDAFAEAIEPLRRATQVDSNSFEAWHNLGLSYFRLHEYKDAREPLEKAAALRPDFFDTLNVLGATLYMLGDDRAALPVLERAHKLRPGDAQLTQALHQLQQSKPQQ
jgi:Flp pilus assembly protein TadD